VRRSAADWQAELDARRARRDAAPDGWFRDLLDEVVVAGERATQPPTRSLLAAWGATGDSIASVLARYAEAVTSDGWHQALTGPWRRAPLDALDLRGMVLRG
jgi:hypothetical protein